MECLRCWTFLSSQWRVSEATAALGEVALAEAAVEEVQDQRHQGVGVLGVVAGAFVAEEGVGSVDLVPVESGVEAR